MAKMRLIHNQTVSGDLLINDIDQGLPVDYLDEQRKQEVYVTFNKKSFSGLEVVTDLDIPGFVDLVLSDKVKLSREQGVIKSFEDAGLLTVLDLAVGEVDAPVITAATQDRTGGSSVTDDDQVLITGTGFLSTNPYESSVILIDDAQQEAVLTRDEVIALGGGNQFTDTQIVVNFGAATVIETVVVIAEGQRVEFAVTAI